MGKQRPHLHSPFYSPFAIRHAITDMEEKRPWPTRMTKKQSHTLADHLLGENFVHDHDGDADHDHDHFDLQTSGPMEENPIWIADHVTLVTVGIDIGSSGTQVIFSRINLRRYGEDLTSRYYVVSRETLFQVAGSAHALFQRRSHRRGCARRHHRWRL